MKRILILDPDAAVLETIVEAMEGYKAFFEVWTSDDHYETLDLLQSLEIDLVVTGMDISRAEELHALKHIRQQYPQLKMILALDPGAADSTPHLTALNIETLLPKPIDFQSLVGQIFKGLETGGHLWGVGISSFLQIAKIDELNCNLNVLSGDNSGRLHIERGELISAQTGTLHAEPAAFEILSWDPVALELDYQDLKPQREISMPLMNIMLESQRLKDEKSSGTDEQRRYPRFACMIPVDYDVNDWSFHNFVRDLSLGGAYIMTKDPVATGDSMILTFTSSSLHKSCMIRGTVARRDASGIGIQFAALDPAQREVIESLLKQALT
ncbi:MAG: PilZ domain-containing protein [Desulfobacterales bacterium]